MNLVDELRARGIEVRQNAYDQNEISICCPFCVKMGESPDFKFRCGINITSGLGHCFNCGWSSRKAVLDLVRILGIADVVDQVISQQYTRQTRKAPEVVELPEGYASLAECEDWDPHYCQALAYVKRRGITREQIKQYEIGATLEDAGRLKNRIIFPVKDAEGELRAWLGRDYTGTAYLRFINMTGGKPLFNARPDLYPHRLAILSEGVIKALAIERAIHNKLCSMAVLGSSITDVQALQLKNFQELILFGDPGGQGVRGMLGIAANLTTMIRTVTLVYPWPEKQADDLTGPEIRHHLRNRVRYNPLVALKIRRELL